MFVHGCFWHGHDCSYFRWPATRPEFWRAKITRNQAVDQAARLALRESGWRVLTVWECALRDRSDEQRQAVYDAAADWLRGDTAELRARWRPRGGESRMNETLNSGQPDGDVAREGVSPRVCKAAGRQRQLQEPSVLRRRVSRAERSPVRRRACVAIGQRHRLQGACGFLVALV